MTSAPSRKRATILLTIGGYANTGISILYGLLLIPFYLHYLGVELYGYWLASGGMLGLLALANFGVGSMVIQRVAQSYGKQDHQQAGAYFVNGVVIYMGICLLYLLIGLAVSFALPTVLKLHGEQSVLVQDCFRLALIGMALGIFNEVLRGLAQALLRPVFTLVSLVVSRLGGLAVTVGLLLHGFGLWAIPIGILVAEGMAFLLNMFETVRLLRLLSVQLVLRVDMMREYLRSSPALFSARLGSTAAQESEPLLITMFLGPEMTTVYMVTRKAADMLFQLISVLNGAVLGPLAHLSGHSQEGEFANVVKTLLRLVMALGVVGFSAYVGLNQVFMELWVNGLAQLDQHLTLLIGLAFFARICRANIWQLLISHGDFIYPSVVVFVEGIVRIVLVIVCLPLFGIVGIPYAMLLALSLALIFLGKRLKEHLDYQLHASDVVLSFITIIVLFSVGEMGSTVLPVGLTWGWFLVVVSVMVSALSILYGLMNWQEVNRLRSYLIRRQA